VSENPHLHIATVAETTEQLERVLDRGQAPLLGIGGLDAAGALSLVSKEEN
jgi:hypothetical protein